MKLYKKVLPYMLAAMPMFMAANSADAQNTIPVPVNHSTELTLSNDLIARASIQSFSPYSINQKLLARAENTRDMYIDNMLAAQKRLAPTIGKKGYPAAVRKELPGAPVGLHCMYGQYTQLMRALNENGDTLQVIPTGAKSACREFKSLMRKRYSSPEYADAIKEGKVYPSDSAYMAAMQKYLASRGINESTPDSARSAAMQQFARNKFSAQQVNPGSIWIVPRFRGAKNTFHAIMFLGEGEIENGEFVPGASGHYFYTAHNREKLGDVFKAWDTSNVFSADIEKILEIEYTKELRRLESLPRDKMIEYITTNTDIAPDQLALMSRQELLKLVYTKYFGSDKETGIPNKTITNNIAQVTMQNIVDMLGTTPQPTQNSIMTPLVILNSQHDLS